MIKLYCNTYIASYDAELVGTTNWVDAVRDSGNGFVRLEPMGYVRYGVSDFVVDQPITIKKVVVKALIRNVYADAWIRVYVGSSYLDSPLYGGTVNWSEISFEMTQKPGGGAWDLNSFNQMEVELNCYSLSQDVLDVDAIWVEVEYQLNELTQLLDKADFGWAFLESASNVLSSFGFWADLVVSSTSGFSVFDLVFGTVNLYDSKTLAYSFSNFVAEVWSQTEEQFGFSDQSFLFSNLLDLSALTYNFNDFFGELWFTSVEFIVLGLIYNVLTGAVEYISLVFETNLAGLIVQGISATDLVQMFAQLEDKNLLIYNLHTFLASIDFVITESVVVAGALNLTYLALNLVVVLVGLNWAVSFLQFIGLVDISNFTGFLADSNLLSYNFSVLVGELYSVFQELVLLFTVLTFGISAINTVVFTESVLGLVELINRVYLSSVSHYLISLISVVQIGFSTLWNYGILGVLTTQALIYPGIGFLQWVNLTDLANLLIFLVLPGSATYAFTNFVGSLQIAIEEVISVWSIVGWGVGVPELISLAGRLNLTAGLVSKVLVGIQYSLVFDWLNKVVLTGLAQFQVQVYELLEFGELIGLGAIFIEGFVIFDLALLTLGIPEFSTILERVYTALSLVSSVYLEDQVFVSTMPWFDEFILISGYLGLLFGLKQVVKIGSVIRQQVSFSNLIGIADEVSYWKGFLRYFWVRYRRLKEELARLYGEVSEFSVSGGVEPNFSDRIEGRFSDNLAFAFSTSIKSIFSE